MNFTRLGCFSNLVIFSSFLIDLIYFGFFLITISLQHYVYVALNIQTFGLCFPRFLQQVDILVLFILSNIVI